MHRGRRPHTTCTMHQYGAGEYDYGDDVNGMCISFNINFHIIYQAFVINNKVFFDSSLKAAYLSELFSVKLCIVQDCNKLMVCIS